MSFPKTLLFTPTPPGERTVGEIYLREIVRALPKEAVCCFAAWPANYGNWLPSSDIGTVPIEFAQLEPEPARAHGLGALVGNMHSCFSRRAYWRTLKPIVEEVVEFSAAQGVEQIYSYIGTPSSVRMTRKIARKLGVPVILHVAEIPGIMMRKQGYDPISTISISKYFDELVRNAQHCVVSSEPLRDYLMGKYGVYSSVLAHPVQRPTANPSRRTARGTTRFVIGYVESSGVSEELIVLLSALKALSWESAGKEIVLRVVGNVMNFPLYAAGINARLEFIGAQSFDEDIRLLSECDLAYMPSTFNRHVPATTRTAMPENLISYLSAGLPVLFHGPKSSFGPRFIERYPIGAFCDLLDPYAVAIVVKSLIANDDLRNQAHQAIELAWRQELNTNVFRSNLSEAVGIESQLLPV